MREARRPRPWQRAQRTARTATGPRQRLIFDTPSNPDPSTRKKLWDPANKEYGSLASADVIMLVYDASTDELTGKKNLEGLEPLLKHIKNTKVRAGRGSALRFCASATLLPPQPILPLRVPLPLAAAVFTPLRGR